LIGVNVVDGSEGFKGIRKKIVATRQQIQHPLPPIDTYEMKIEIHLNQQKGHDTGRDLHELTAIFEVQPVTPSTSATSNRSSPTVPWF